MTTGLAIICRSELAREKHPGTAFILDNHDSSDFFASKLAPTQNPAQKKTPTRRLALFLTACRSP
jgi:hypothetical protein